MWGYVPGGAVVGTARRMKGKPKGNPRYRETPREAVPSGLLAVYFLSCPLVGLFITYLMMK